MPDELDDLRIRFLALVARFELRKRGADPLEWNADELDAQCSGASHGEQCTIRFLLHVWDPRNDWQCGPFDFFDAWATWDAAKQEAFLSWANDPFWP